MNWTFPLTGDHPIQQTDILAHSLHRIVSIHLYFGAVLHELLTSQMPFGLRTWIWLFQNENIFCFSHLYI